MHTSSADYVGKEAGMAPKAINLNIPKAKANISIHTRASALWARAPPLYPVATLIWQIQPSANFQPPLLAIVSVDANDLVGWIRGFLAFVPRLPPAPYQR